MTFTDEQRQAIYRVKDSIQNLLSERGPKLPFEIQKIISYNGIVTGGISASIFHGEDFNDIDIYLRTDESKKELERLLEQYQVLDLIADVNPKYMIDTTVPGKLITANAITFKNKFQVIRMHLADARETFDFIHTMPYYDCATRIYHISPTQCDSIMRKKLIPNSSPNSFGVTERRKQKFIDRGWTI